MIIYNTSSLISIIINRASCVHHHHQCAKSIKPCYHHQEITKDISIVQGKSKCSKISNICALEYQYEVLTIKYELEHHATNMVVLVQKSLGCDENHRDLNL
jgi:hypothetical protein